MMPASSTSVQAMRLESPLYALCWVHAERLVHELDAFTDLHLSRRRWFAA
jgi:hypothetical protein